jgi:hypothetical protein
LVPGVGSTEPNEKDEDAESEELEDDTWMKLLDIGDDQVLSLKTWKEVAAMKANKVHIALALRAIMRQAWSEHILIYYFPI